MSSPNDILRLVKAYADMDAAEQNELLAAAENFQSALDEIECLRAKAFKAAKAAGELKQEVESLRDAVEFAHSEGFEWPTDPLPSSP